VAAGRYTLAVILLAFGGEWLNPNAGAPQRGSSTGPSAGGGVDSPPVLAEAEIISAG